MLNRFEGREDPVVLEHDVEDFGSALEITVKVDQQCEMADLGFLHVNPDSIIQSALLGKGWITEEGTTVVHFKMDVRETKNSDGTQEWVFRYYLPLERQ